MSKFKIGDIVTGTNDSIYMVTNTRMLKGKVVKILNNKIDIEIIEHKDKRWERETFINLNPNYFRKVIKNDKYKISDVLEKLEKEINELQNKIDNLILYTNKLDRETMKSKGISKAQQDLLMSQVHAMMTYHSILKIRIEDLEEEKDLKKTLNILYGKFVKED